VGALVVAGLVLGSIYAISVLGLVLTYTSSRVFNFAHGALAYFIAVLFYWLHEEHGWPIPLAALVSLLVFAPLIGLFLWAVLFRHLTYAPPVVRFVSTVGLWVALPALTKVLFPFTKSEIFDPQGLAGSNPAVYDVFGVGINMNQIVVLAGAAIVAIGLTVLLRLTPFGLSIRATVDSRRVASISGLNTTFVSATSWMLGTMLAGLAGILLSPILGLSEIIFTLLLVASFGAAVVGRLTSLPLAFAGAMFIGLVQEVSREWLPEDGVLARGFRPSFPFVVMLVALLLYQGLQREEVEIDVRATSQSRPEAPAPPPVRGWRAAVGPIAVALVLFSVPLWLDDFWVGVMSQGVALGVLFLTFTMVTGEGGMVSLCQVTLAGLGAFTAAKLATDAGWPVGLAIVAGGLLAVPIGLAVAAMSIRLGGLYLALATLAFAQLVETLVFAREDFENFGAGVEIPRPELFGIDFSDRTNFYLLLAGVFCVVAILVANLRRGTTGLVFASTRSSEAASATIGLSVIRSKMFAFGLSAFLAGLGGSLFAVTIGRATVSSFNMLIGIVWLAIVVTWGVRSIVGALIAGLIYALAPQLVNQYLSEGWVDVPTLLFGLGAIALAREPRGVIFDVANRHRLRRLRRQVRQEEAAAAASPAGRASVPA
jgi:branched-chain amino acid transport system permease protein